MKTFEVTVWRVTSNGERLNERYSVSADHVLIAIKEVIEYVARRYLPQRALVSDWEEIGEAVS